MQRILSISYCLFCLPPLAVLESVAPEPGPKRIFQGSDVFGWMEEITSSSSVCSEFSPFPKLQESTCASQHYPQKKTSHPVPSLLPNVDKFCTPCTGSRNRLLSTIHDVILKASESLLILEASSEQTLFWAKLSIALSPIVWFRNLCHSSIWVGSYLKKNMTTTLGISSVTRQRSSPG